MREDRLSLLQTNDECDEAKNRKGTEAMQRSNTTTTWIGTNLTHFKHLHM